MENPILINNQQNHKSDEFTSVLGMTILLASLSMLFIALIASYGILRVRAVEWNSKSMSDFSIILAWLNTVLIGSSSFIYSKIKKVNFKNEKLNLKLLNLTIFSGLLFLILQLVLWFELSNIGFSITSHQAGSVFYMLSGLHGLHIIFGIFSLFWLKNNLEQREHPKLKIKLVGMFWHFLTIIWLIIFFSVIIF